MLGSFISSGQLVHIYCSEVKPECKTSHVSYSGGILIRVKLSCRLRRALSSWCLAQDSTSLCYTGQKKKKVEIFLQEHKGIFLQIILG